MPSAAAKKKATALALPQDVGSSKRGRPMPGKADLRRYVMHKVHGMSPEEIAERTKCSPIAVQESINYVTEYKGYYSNELLQTKIIEVTMEHMEQVGKVWTGGLNAKKKEKDGRVVADTTTRLKTVESIRSMVEVVQPKAPGVQLNQQFNNPAGGPGGQFSPGMSFESRLRAIREKRGLKNEDAVEVLEGQTGEDGESLEDELDGIGVDLDEGDEEEGSDE